MDSKEIVKRINDAEKNEADYINFYIEDECQIIKSACNKTIPKQIVKITNSDGLVLSVCPTCLCSVNNNQEYCSICGQHLCDDTYLNKLKERVNG